MSWHTKRLLRELRSVTLPAAECQVAKTRIREIVLLYTAKLDPREPLADQLEALALSCYTQGLLDGASPEVRERLAEFRVPA